MENVSRVLPNGIDNSIRHGGQILCHLEKQQETSERNMGVPLRRGLSRFWWSLHAGTKWQWETPNRTRNTNHMGDNGYPTPNCPHYTLDLRA